MNGTREATARETQDKPQSDMRRTSPPRSRMLGAGIVMLLAVAAAAPGQSAQSEEQQERQFRERFERQRQELAQRREQLGQTVRQVEAQLRESQRALNEQSRQQEQRLDELHKQIRQTEYEQAELRRQELAERTRYLADQLRNHQEQSRRIEQELRELERAGDGQMRGPERVGPAQDRREEAPRSRAAPESRVPRREGRDQALPQIEALGRRVNQLERELKASKERDRPRVERSGDESRRERTPPQQAQPTIIQVECEKVVRQDNLAAEVGDLRARMDAIQQQVSQTNAVLNSVLSQAGRSTVGSAGYFSVW